MIVLNVNDFYNIHEYYCNNATIIHEVSHFITILLKALPKIASISFYNSNQEENIYNEKGIDENIIILNVSLSININIDKCALNELNET